MIEEMNDLVAELQKQHKTVTVAESLTCGLFQALLGDVSGVSNVFPGGFVTYSAQMKEAIGVSKSLIQSFGTVSEECAVAMAEESKKRVQTDYALSFTGVAGPNELEGKPVGTVWIGVATQSEVFAEEYHFQGSRQEIRKAAVQAGIQLLSEQLKK